VATQSRWDTGRQPATNVVDIYRLHEGRIVEHWDVIQDRGGAY
jgi:predicted SnoaL-like aldol condensation-catalyzing enzyme